MKATIKHTILAAIFAAALLALVAGCSAGTAGTLQENKQPAIKNLSTGFVGNDIELARPSQPVSGFVQSDVDI